MKQYSKQILVTAFMGLGLFSSGIAQVENKMEELKKSVDKIFIKIGAGSNGNIIGLELN